jgi:glutamyl-Q tRNA(Asp) synthetase
MHRGSILTEAKGRFAPSPTGDLHFGSLVSALASYLQTKSSGGRWVIRIEDIDPPREVPGSANRILAELGRFGLHSDDPVLYQSTRLDAYHEELEKLLAQGRAFWCGCSRSELPPSGIYPGTCRNGMPAGKKARSIRLRVEDKPIVFEDRILGRITENLHQSVGDFVIQRADGLPAYQLAVVVDDAFQAVTEVVRGTDLLESTARQVYLQECLDLPTPTYAHHPLALRDDGQKLSKRLGSDPIAQQRTGEVLGIALDFLGHPSPPELSCEGVLQWARDNWRLSKIPASSRYNAASPR